LYEGDLKIDSVLTVRIYEPNNKTSNSLPIGVFGHGGGFCGGDLNSDDKIARYVAERVPCVVVSVDYRLGPKYKFPTMLDDFEEAFNWVTCAKRSAACTCPLQPSISGRNII
jgi:versiconal hemiacetal acetate esterase